jgi:hypothetical protein
MHVYLWSCFYEATNVTGDKCESVSKCLYALTINMPINVKKIHNVNHTSNRWYVILCWYVSK